MKHVARTTDAKTGPEPKRPHGVKRYSIFRKAFCVRCNAAFWQGICVVTKDAEELDAWVEACCEE